MRFLSLKLITPPVAEPVTLAQAKAQLRIDYAYDDTFIPTLISAAREWVEAYLHRKLFDQTWQRTLDYFPLWYGGTTINPANFQDWMYYSDYWQKVMIQLPGQVESVTSITYVLPNGGGTKTLDASSYVFDGTSIPARLVPSQGMTWPVQALYQPGSVAITYIAGSWGDGITVNTCPASIQQAILMLVSHMYNNRDAISAVKFNELPFAVKALLTPFKVETFAVA